MELWSVSQSRASTIALLRGLKPLGVGRGRGTVHRQCTRVVIIGSIRSYMRVTRVLRELLVVGAVAVGRAKVTVEHA